MEKLIKIYEKIYKTSMQIRNAMEKDDRNLVLNLIKIKDDQIKDLNRNKELFEKYKDHPKLKDLVDRVNRSELENIEFCEHEKNILLQELNQNFKDTKLLNAYNNNIDKNQMGSILDFSQ